MVSYHRELYEKQRSNAVQIVRLNGSLEITTVFIKSISNFIFYSNTYKCQGNTIMVFVPYGNFVKSIITNELIRRIHVLLLFIVTVGGTFLLKHYTFFFYIYIIH